MPEHDCLSMTMMMAHGIIIRPPAVMGSAEFLCQVHGAELQGALLLLHSLGVLLGVPMPYW